MFVKKTNMVVNKKGPFIDLRKLKSSNTKINEKQTAGKFHIINGDLNFTWMGCFEIKHYCCR